MYMEHRKLRECRMAYQLTGKRMLPKALRFCYRLAKPINQIFFPFIVQKTIGDQVFDAQR